MSVIFFSKRHKFYGTIYCMFYIQKDAIKEIHGQEAEEFCKITHKQ